MLARSAAVPDAASAAPVNEPALAGMTIGIAASDSRQDGHGQQRQAACHLFTAARHVRTVHPGPMLVGPAGADDT